MSAATAESVPTPLRGLPLFIAGFALALANFIVVLDITIANVSVPHIAGGLAVSPSQGTWTITSYAVAEAITVPLSGWLAGRFGAVRLLFVSLIGFGLFSLLCGMASTIEMLVAFRVLQGLSGGPLMPLTQSLMTRVFPPEKIPMALGLWGVTTISAPILGPILGGLISDNWSWPWIFFINLPVVAICAFVVWRILPPFETVKIRARIDRIGLILLILWVGSFQMMLDVGREHDWFESTYVLMLGLTALIAFFVFVIWEWYEPHPIVDIRLLKDRTLAMSTLSVSLAFGCFFATVVLVPLWLQQVIGFTATEAGNISSYMGVLAVMLAPVAAMLLSRVDPRITISLGIVWMACTTLMRAGWSTEAGYWQLVMPQLLQGLGTPFFFIGLTTLALTHVRAKDTASAAGIMTFMRTMSGAIGTAIATTYWDVLTQRSRGELVNGMNDVEGTISRMEGAGMDKGQATGIIDRLVDQQAMTNGVLEFYHYSVVIFLIAAAVVWLVPKPVLPLKPNAGH